MKLKFFVGFCAAFGAAIIGSGWQLATRHGVSTTLGPLELALLRYGLPALVLAPVWLRGSLVQPGVRRYTLTFLVIGGGLPFGILVFIGAQWAPAAHIGVFMAGGMPLFTALGAWAVKGERVQRIRLVGLLCIVFGMVFLTVANWQSNSSSWRGDALFLLAAVFWAIYTLVFAQTGLTPWQGAAFVNGWSSLLLIPFVLGLGVPRLLSAPWRDVALQAFGQGILAGMLGLAFYSIAIERLGALRASLSAALVPVLTAIGAVWLLGEPVTEVTVLALSMMVPGVVLASGIFQSTAEKKA